MKRGKPYLKKIGNFSGFDVWYVDGLLIRKNIDIDFTNFGQHYRFDFIPKNEFWIDQEFGEIKEAKFYIKHLLVENKLMEKGVKWPTPIEKGDKAELAERKKDKKIATLLKEKNKTKILNAIRKKFIKKYLGKIKIWLVRGSLVRTIFDIDFTQGGHDRFYDFIPENEIWIDDAISPKDREFSLLHELHERNLMGKGKGYGSHFLSDEWKASTEEDSAHKSASEIEKFCRKNPEELKRILLKEIRMNK